MVTDFVGWKEVHYILYVDKDGQQMMADRSCKEGERLKFLSISRFSKFCICIEKLSG